MTFVIGRSSAHRTLATLGFAAILVAGCAAPGAVATPPPTAAPSTAASAAASTPGEASASAVATVPDCGTDPIKLSIYHETISDLMPQLSAEFTKQYPNVTFDLKADSFANATANLPRLLSGDNPPDIARAAQLIDLAKDGLLLNFDPYATAYGWDAWPQAQFESVRINSDFKRGTGSIIAWPVNPSTVGVFYNKDLATQIGMTTPPKTVDEFDALLAKAKTAGLQPIMQWNASTSGGGLAFPLQNLMAAYGPTQPINDWIFQKKGATIDTPTNLTAAQHLETWVKSGYFPKDVNAIEYTAANSRFGKGEGVFMFNGDWQDATYDKDQPGNVGFFIFPSATSGGSVAAMSAPLTYGIAAKAKNADCAAFFLNWVATNTTARQIDVAVGGSTPGGPSDLPVPAGPSGSVINDTLAQGASVAKANGAMDFIANATGSIFAQGWTPELQKMVGGKETADGLLKAVQAEYVKELSQ